MAGSMTKHIPDLDSETFHNWIKLGLALLYVRNVIENLVEDDTKQFQKEMLKEVYTKKGVKRGTLCEQCNIANLVQCPGDVCNKRRNKPCPIHSQYQTRTCPEKICNTFYEMIRGAHFYHSPSWKNTETERWCKESVHIAKCFMPKEGYLGVDTFDKIDFNGIINVVINSKRLRAKFTKIEVATEAREVGKRFRHSPDLSITGEDLVNDIDVLVALLTDPKQLQNQDDAKEAITMLKQLKTQKLDVSAQDTAEVLTDISKAKKEGMEIETDIQMRDIIKQQVTFLRGLLEAAEAMIERITTTNIAKIINVTDRSVYTVRRAGEKEIQGIKREGEKQREYIQKRRKYNPHEILTETGLSSQSSSYRRISESESYPALLEDLRSDLNILYKERHIYLPVSPLAHENKAPLLEFYVTPSMKCKELSNRPYANQENEQTTNITSYREVFLKGESKHKNIYIAAPAGMGKTSYLKRMSLAWCWTHFPYANTKDDDNQYFTKDDLETMKEFNFLFFVSLREAGKTFCHTDELIFSQVIRHLSQSYRYNEDFIQEVLHTEMCLILVDGLDEWTHPEESCELSSNSVIPHRKAREMCTIIYTTRPLKMNAVGQCEESYRNIEMHGLEERSVSVLINNAIFHLNTNYHDNKSADDFCELLKENRVYKLKSIPLLLLQMICLWFAYGRLGRSRCEIYSNILEFLFSHGMNRRDRPDTRSQKRRHPSNIPKCFSKCTEVCKHPQLLSALGKLAFDGLFGRCSESSLIFADTVVREYLDKGKLNLCKNIGILSQTNAPRNPIVTDSNFSFIHKTYQEFLAALYISINRSPCVLEQVFNFCTSTSDILQVSNVFIFVSGMNPDMSEKLSRRTAEIVSKDERTSWFRKNIGTIFIKSRIPMRRLHTMMMTCMQESFDNGFKRVVMTAEDIAITRKCKFHWLQQKCLINKNVENIRSLDIQVEDMKQEIHELFQSLDQKSLTNLTKIFIWGEIHIADITTAIRASSMSLTCIELWYLTFTDDLIAAIAEVKHLEAFSLLSVTLSHRQLEDLMEFLKGTQNLLQLSLNALVCSDHTPECCNGYSLNLMNNSKLNLIVLDNLSLTQIHLNAHQLATCVIEWLHIDGILSSLLDSLRNAPALDRLECTGVTNCSDLDSLVKVFPTLTALKYMRLRTIDLGDRYLNLEHCRSLECVYLWKVSINVQTMEQMMTTIKNQDRSVIVMMEGCKLTPEDSSKDIKEKVKNETECYEVIRDIDVENEYGEFYFKTKNKNKKGDPHT